MFATFIITEETDGFQNKTTVKVDNVITKIVWGAGVAIPTRELKLNMSKVAEAQASVNHIMTLFGK